MKNILLAAIGIFMLFAMNNSPRAQGSNDTQKDHIFGENIHFTQVGHLDSWDEMTYKINISWQTNKSDINAINIYVKDSDEEKYHLLQTIAYKDGNHTLYVRPARKQRYVLTSIDTSLAESMYSKELDVTTGWKKASRDLSEIIFINNIAYSSKSEHREFANKTLDLAINPAERKKILTLGAKSDDLTMRAFSLLGLGYIRGWNKYIPVFEENISNDDPMVRWAAISSLYLPKGPIEKPYLKRKKEYRCKQLYKLSSDESQAVRAKVSFLLDYMTCTESNK